MQTILVGVSYPIIQHIYNSSQTSVITVEVRRVSDNYTFDFSSGLFAAAPVVGRMLYESSGLWKSSFLPPSEDTYVVTVVDVTQGNIPFFQQLKAVIADSSVISAGILYTLVQPIHSGVPTDQVTIEIKRMSDGYLYDFNAGAFTASATPSSMLYSSGYLWKTTFMPATADTYLCTITDVTQDNVTYYQQLKAVVPDSLIHTSTNSGLSSRRLALLNRCRQYMPQQFLQRLTDDTLLLSFLELVLAELNSTPPATGYVIESMPSTWDSLVAWGAQIYATLFLQAGYALQDFSYSDGGLSLTIDRHGSLNVTYQNLYTRFEKIVANMKKTEILKVRPCVLATPSHSTVFAQYLASIFPGTWPMR